VKNPNPSCGIVNIVVDNAGTRQKLKSISVVNLLGQEIYQSSLDGSGNFRIETSAFEKGCYFIILSDDIDYRTTKIVMLN